MTERYVPAWDTTIEGETLETEIAKVERFHLGQEDHGLFTVELTFGGSGWGQGISPHSLDEYNSELKKRVGTAFGMDYIMAVVNRLGSPEQAVGKQVVVYRSKINRMIVGFATMSKDGKIGDPFFPQKLADRHYPR